MVFIFLGHLSNRTETSSRVSGQTVKVENFGDASAANQNQQLQAGNSGHQTDGVGGTGHMDQHFRGAQGGQMGQQNYHYGGGQGSLMWQQTYPF